MESFNFYQHGSLSSLAAQSIPGVAANPSLHPNVDDYIRYMNNSLPITTEALPTKHAKFPDMGYDEYESCPNPSTSILQNAVEYDLNQNLCPTWACPNPSFTNTCVFNDTITINASSNWGLLSSNPSIDSGHTAMNFFNNNGEDRSPLSNEDSSLSSNYGRIHRQDSTHTQSTTSNKISSRTKRLISTSSESRQPQLDEAVKKQKAVTQASAPSPKVGKEKIGDRIAGLHRLVAPFGKTDAASVLTEAIGYIQFLQHQIQTLSMPCIKPSLRDRRTFEWVSSKKDEKHGDLRSRGLCLVPSSIASYISSSCTLLDLDAV